MKSIITKTCMLLVLAMAIASCNQPEKKITETKSEDAVTEAEVVSETPEYYMLRPEVEKAYGYTHAVKIGNSIKISGAVSMDNEGNPTAVGNLLCRPRKNPDPLRLYV